MSDSAEPEIDELQPTGVASRSMTDLIDRVVSGRRRAAEALLIVATMVAAWLVRFVQDDAFISYRYSRNAARGDGLVFNPGEQVEGYTNFLWTWIHIWPEKWGWDTPRFSMILGILLAACALVVGMHLGRRVMGSWAWGYLTGLVLAANMTFLGYATGGLETMLQALLLVLIAFLLLPDKPSTRNRVLAGIVAGLAVLTRLDSTVIAGTLVVSHLWALWRLDGNETATSVRLRNTFVRGVSVGIPILLIVVPWLVWKLDYYGDLLPNTFYAKSATNPLIPIAYGAFYSLCFFGSYAAFVFIGRWRRNRSELLENPLARYLLVIIPVWIVYICVVGGDFMEFRFFVALLPALAIVAAFVLNRFRSPKKQIALVLILLMVSGIHRVVPGVGYPVLTFKDLSHWPTESKTSWAGMGNTLHDAFPGKLGDPGRPTIAVAPLGVISYFSDLETIDMLGLTDEHIAREGLSVPIYYPGHVRMAPLDYLIERDVDIVIGQPYNEFAEADRTKYRLTELTVIYPVQDLRALPDTARVIEIPLTPRKIWPVIWIGGDDVVATAIAENGWKTFPIERICDDADLNVITRMSAEATCPDL